MSQNFKNKINLFLKSIFLITIAFLSIQVLAVWTPPTQAPTSGNVPPPVNVGTSLQYKDGNFVANGLKGIYAFQLGDSTTAGYVLTANSSGVGTWQAPTGGGSSQWTTSGNNIYNSNSGNVGIGITVPADKLQVETNVNAMSGITVKNLSNASNARASITFDAGNGAATGWFGILPPGYTQFPAWADSQVFWANSSASGGLILGTSGNPIRFMDSTSNEVMRITSSNIGIGTTNPTQKLDIAGTAKMTGFQLGTSTTAGYVLTANSSGVGTWQAPTGGGSSQWTTSGNNIYNSNSGNVGIGITNPARKLDISDRIKLRAATYSAGIWLTDSGGTENLFIGQQTTSSSSSFGIWSNSAWQFTVSNLGNVGIGTTNPTQKLDIAGTAKMTGFQLGTSTTSGYVLTANSSGVGTWQAPTGGGVTDGDKGDITVTNSGSVWTINPLVVTTGKIANNAVNNPKILDNAVTNPKIIANAITTDKISDGTIATADIANNAITVAKLPAGATGTTFLRGDGTWQTPTGGGSPGGSNGYIQFNNNGSFGGNSNLTWDTSQNNSLKVGSGGSFVGITTNAIFFGAMRILQLGNSSLYLGNGGQSSTGSHNTFLGLGTANSNTSGNSNTAVGLDALYNNTSGNANTAIGNFALNSNTTGSFNTAIGNLALNSNTTGSFNTAIGLDSGVVNNASNSTVVGYGATVTTSNKVRIGNMSVTVIEGQVAWSFPSDIRIKKDIMDSDLGLNFINTLRPVSYRLKEGGSGLSYGFIAQEVEEALGGKKTNIVLTDSDAQGMKTMRYTDLIAPMVKAIQELKLENDTLKARLELLENKIK